MKKYCLLQLKRILRFLPWGLCVVLVLFGCMSLVFNAMLNTQTDNQTAKLRIGVVGTAGDTYLQWGLAAMEFDSTSMSIQLVAMDEAVAHKALEQGEISAYVVFPENFMNDALSGNVGSLQLVSTFSTAGLVSILKEEITVLVEKILIACENGSYGAGDAVADHGDSSSRYTHVNALSLEFADFLLDRSRMYRVESPEQNNIPFDRYMLAGLSVLLLMLACLPFAPLYVRGDHSLSRMLRARRVGAAQQVMAEFGAFLLTMLLLLGAVAAVLQISKLLPQTVSGLMLFFNALPTVLMVASLAYCAYNISNQLISGVLLTFFLVLVLCFMGGCMYPIQVFPAAMQNLATLLPTGIARQSLTCCLMGTSVTGTWPLIGYSCVFLAIAVAVRSYKTGKVWG